MPRFHEKASSFDVTTDWNEEPVTVTVRWTPEADDKFACLFTTGQDRDTLRVPEAEAYELLCEQVASWKGVEDADGNEVPFSLEKFRSLLPIAVKVRLIQRFIDTAITFQNESAADPT